MASALPRPVARLVGELSRLPGIGPKSASRLAFHLLRSPDKLARDLAEALLQLADSVVTCQKCQNVAEVNPCPVCLDPDRDGSVVCVVEEPLDVIALERTGRYRGLYHVLHGAISPVDGVSPSDLRIAQLLDRLSVEPIRELILATNPTLEGDATAMYLERAIRSRQPGISLTRLARGLPVGGDIEYDDEVTLARAMEGRREIS